MKTTFQATRTILAKQARIKVSLVALAILLCYGQLLAGVHMVGHLAPYHDSSTTLHTHPHAERLEQSFSTKSDKSTSSHAHSHAGTVDEITQPTCTTYHVLLGFSGLISIDALEITKHPVDTHPLNLIVASTCGINRTFSSIRAPPLLF